MSKSKKGKSKIVLLVFIFWFFILLPTLKGVFSDLISSKNDFTSFIETEEDLQYLIDKEKALFPQQFFQIETRWESNYNSWLSSWHIYEPYLSESISELDHLVILRKSSGSKKGKNSSLSSDKYWAQVYKTVADNNSERIENLALAFIWFQEKNELSDREILEMMIDYFQQIPYEIPENKFGLYTPSEVVFENAGDCDSKSVFAATILKRLGFDVAIFYSSEYSHAMLGINVPSTGLYKEMNGKNYYFTEMTAVGWQIGELPADCSDPDFWFISSI